MKKLVILFCCVTLLFSVAAVSFASGEKDKGAGAPEAAKPTAVKGKTFKIGYSCISWTIPWMVFYKELFEEEIA